MPSQNTATHTAHAPSARASKPASPSPSARLRQAVLQGSRGATRPDCAAPVAPVAHGTFPGSEETTPDRLLECMASFYRSGLAARLAEQNLRQSHGLLASQLVLLGPADASRLRFARHALGWAPDEARDPMMQHGDGWLAGVAGALLAGLAMLVWLTVNYPQPEDWPNLFIPLALMLGAALGAGLVAVLAWPRRPQRFDVNVRQQLQLGCWALVACRVPWSRQAEVVAQMRHGSDKWCAVAPRMHRL